MAKIPANNSDNPHQEALLISDEFSWFRIVTYRIYKFIGPNNFFLFSSCYLNQYCNLVKKYCKKFLHYRPNTPKTSKCWPVLGFWSIMLKQFLCPSPIYSHASLKVSKSKKLFLGLPSGDGIGLKIYSSILKNISC